MPRHALAATLALLIPAVLVPVLEINATHLTNPDWPPHARLHEAWQLITNATLALIALWLGWMRRRWHEAAGLGLVITLGFLAAWALRGYYGGSMAGTTSGSTALLGVDVAVWVMGAASLLLAWVALCAPRLGRTGR